MSSNKNRFNTSTKTKDWFPFAKYLFITEQHPIRQSEEKCSSSIEALFSQQELEQINGIANSLQCETRDAVRIALFEVVKDAKAAHEKSYEKAKSGSKIKGHEGRKTKMRLNLPKVERDAAAATATDLNITSKEFLRLAVIWLADGIKEETIIRLTKSTRINKDDVAMGWSRNNKGKPPSESTAKLKAARDKAYNDAAKRGQERDEELYVERGRMMEKLNNSGLGRSLQDENGNIDLNIVDAHIAIEDQEWLDETVNQFEVKNELEREIFRVMLQSTPEMSDEDIETIAQGNIIERQEQQRWTEFCNESTDEELLDADKSLFWMLRTPFSYYSTDFTWQNDDDAKRRENETADDYVLRSLPEELHSEWNAWRQDSLQQLRFFVDPSTL
jgi:hypothetical protein